MLGGAEVGIRSTSTSFMEWLDHALGSHKVPDQFHQLYSVVIAEPTGKAALAKERHHILYKGTIATIKTPDIRTLVRTLLSDLEMFFLDDRNDAVFVDMNVVALKGKRALVPGSLVPFIGTVGRRRVARTGLTLPAERAAAIEPGSGMVIPVEPMLKLTPGSMEVLTDVVPADGQDSRVVIDEPILLDAVVSIGWRKELLIPISKGLGLYRLGSHVLNLEVLGGSVLEAMRPLAERVPSFEMSSAKPVEMLDSLLRVFASTSSDSA